MTPHMPIAVRPHPSPTPPAQRALRLENPGFGMVFTDHMVTATWTAERGWHDGEVCARAPLTLHPAAAALHYAQEIFEGLKAYRRTDGALVLFRPQENARRFAHSAERMAMPAVPEPLFLAAIEALVRIDRDWIPDGDGSLYIRPFMVATEPFLAVRPANQYLFCVIASPVGAYFKGGAKPIRVWVPAAFSRAAPGGTGSAKCGGNYAASLLAQAEASRNGCDQVMFLDAARGRWVEELGGMNAFFVMADGRLVTPPLSGTILAGVTRSSILTLARDSGLVVEERPYSFPQLRRDAQSGALREAFACGTAAVIAAIGEVRHAGGAFTVADGQTGAVTARLRAQLIGLQRGLVEDRHDWVRRVD